MDQLTTLANGIRVVSETVPYAHGVAIGVWIDTGSRDEPERYAGISHFIEHLVFKGTERRTARDIAEELDAVGGELNAFTEKEQTCYYVKVLPEHVEVALDVLGDMILHAALDPPEFEREKNVIIEEIKLHEDTPEDLVHDVLAHTLWPRHPLGRSIIGRPEVIEALQRDEVLAYLRRQYAPSRTVIAAAGNLEHGRLVKLAGRFFGEMKGEAEARVTSPLEASHEEVSLTRPAEQVHFCLGMRGYGQCEEERYALGLVDTALGGGMSSRLFQEVRENRGLCYSIGSYTAAHREGGMFAVFASASPETAEEVEDLSRREMAQLAREGLGDAELERAKNQIRGAVLLGLDSMSGRMTRLAKSLLYYDRIIPVDEVVEKITRVTPDEARRVAGEVFGSGEFAYAAIGPLEDDDDGDD